MHFIPRFVLVRVCSCIFGVIFGIGAGASLDMLAQASGLRMIRPFGNTDQKTENRKTVFRLGEKFPLLGIISCSIPIPATESFLSSSLVLKARRRRSLIAHCSVDNWSYV